MLGGSLVGMVRVKVILPSSTYWRKRKSLKNLQDLTPLELFKRANVIARKRFTRSGLVKIMRENEEKEKMEEDKLKLVVIDEEWTETRTLDKAEPWIPQGEIFIMSGKPIDLSEIEKRQAMVRLVKKIDADDLTIIYKEVDKLA